MSFAPDQEEIDEAFAAGDCATLKSMLETVEAERLALMRRQIDRPTSEELVDLWLRTSESAQKGAHPWEGVGFYVDVEPSTRKAFVPTKLVARWLVHGAQQGKE